MGRDVQWQEPEEDAQTNRAAWRQADNSSRQRGTFRNIWSRLSVQEQSAVRLDRSAWGSENSRSFTQLEGISNVDMILLTPEIAKQYKV